MKVLFVINSMATGGAEKVVFDLIVQLKQRGYKVDLALLNAQDTLFKKKLTFIKDVQLITLGKSNNYNPIKIFRIAKLLKRYDLVHVHLFPSLYFSALGKLLSFSNVPLLYTEHSTQNRRRNSYVFRWLDRLFYKRYEGIVTISTEVKLFLLQHLKISRLPVITIPNGVDLMEFHNMDEIKKIDGTKTISLVQIARLTQEKDHETLLKAIPYVNHSVVLKIIGEGPLQGRLQQLAKMLEIENQVEFQGIQENIPEILNEAAIAILSSNHEGLSLSGLEAMASGTPLVASKVPGLTTLVHGAGVLFEHKDHLDLAEKINELIESPEYYKRVAQACLERSKKYSLEKMVDAHIALYKELCQNQN